MEGKDEMVRYDCPIHRPQCDHPNDHQSAQDQDKALQEQSDTLVRTTQAGGPQDREGTVAAVALMEAPPPRMPLCNFCNRDRASRQCGVCDEWFCAAHLPRPVHWCFEPEDQWVRECYGRGQPGHEGTRDSVMGSRPHTSRCRFCEKWEELDYCRLCGLTSCLACWRAHARIGCPGRPPAW